ncbi:MAG: SRPBCC domain-containing protein [Bacteroidia bacterium]
MKQILSMLTLLLLASSFTLVNYPDSYITDASQVKGKHTIFTEIVINASPQVVRAKFLEFQKWGEWNSMIPEIALKTGNLDSIETKPTLDLTLDFSRKNDPAPAPVFPEVYANNKQVFEWGFHKWYLHANHPHLFESLDNGTKTRFINYEVMGGLFKSLIMTKKTKANMTEHFIKMNKDFKKFCEQ